MEVGGEDAKGRRDEEEGRRRSWEEARKGIWRETCFGGILGIQDLDLGQFRTSTQGN